MLDLGERNCVASTDRAYTDMDILKVRYSFVITPVNYSLAAVNFFVGANGLAQLYRIWDYRRSNPVAAAIKK